MGEKREIAHFGVGSQISHSKPLPCKAIFEADKGREVWYT